MVVVEQQVSQEVGKKKIKSVKEKERLATTHPKWLLGKKACVQTPGPQATYAGTAALVHMRCMPSKCAMASYVPCFHKLSKMWAWRWQAFKAMQWDGRCHYHLILFLGFIIFWSKWEKDSRVNPGLALEIKRDDADLEAMNRCVKMAVRVTVLQGE